MKSSFGSKGGRKDLLIAEDMTRREFLRAGVGLAAWVWVPYCPEALSHFHADAPDLDRGSGLNI